MVGNLALQVAEVWCWGPVKLCNFLSNLSRNVSSERKTRSVRMRLFTETAVKLGCLENSDLRRDQENSDHENSDHENSDHENSDHKNSDHENSDLENSDLENSDPL